MPVRLTKSVALSILLLAGTARAAEDVPPRTLTATPTSAEADLLQAEGRRLQAQVTRDMTALADGVADEAIYTHANGHVQTKAEYIASILNGRFQFKSVATEGRFARVTGALGMTHGTQRLVVGDMHLADTYLAVYVRRAGRWQLLAWQSAPMPQSEERRGEPGPAAAHALAAQPQ